MCTYGGQDKLMESVISAVWVVAIEPRPPGFVACACLLSSCSQADPPSSFSDSLVNTSFKHFPFRSEQTGLLKRLEFCAVI